jgi:hypothetical protein
MKDANFDVASVQKKRRLHSLVVLVSVLLPDAVHGL